MRKTSVEKRLISRGGRVHKEELSGLQIGTRPRSLLFINPTVEGGRTHVLKENHCV